MDLQSGTGKQRRVRGAATWLAIVGFLAFGASNAGAQSVFPFRHAVALFHPMTAGLTTPGPNKQFLPQPFSGPKKAITEAQLDAITKAGFDFVRLPVDPGPFLQFQGEQRDAIDSVLKQNVQMIIAHGLGVIVDFHPDPYGPTDYLPAKLVDSADAPLFRAYCAMLSRTAKLLAGIGSDHVAFELMNEPPVGWSQSGFAKWQDLQGKLYHAARNGAPNLTLVLTGGSGSNFSGLVALNPRPFARDPRVLFTYHYYYPYEFTMQSEKKNSVRSVLFDVPYPSSARPMSDSLQALSSHLDENHVSLAEKAAALAQATATLTVYKTKGFSRSNIEADFDQVADWAKKNGIAPSRIFLGEFGCIRNHDIYLGARESERGQWLRDVSQAASQRGFIWSLWAFSGTGGMEITDAPDWTNVDPATVSELGLH